jgi:hypothetical protein
MPDTIDDAQEHPIILNKWSINRILAGEKTQTRSIVKPEPPEPQEESHYFDAYNGGPQWNWWDQENRVCNDAYYDVDGISWTCPFGTPGDVLWVREGFRLAKRLDDTSPKEAATEDGMVEPPVPQVRYEADGRIITEADEWGRKRPSAHMPRELCRLRLRVEDVRVERVQQISGEDARAEGCLPDTQSDGAARLEFCHKWNETHGDGAWERNDWVWVIEFARYDE